MIPKTFFSIALFFFVIVVVEDYVVEDYFLHDCCCCVCLFVCFFSSKRLYLTHSEEHVLCKLCFVTQPLLPEDLKCD